MTSSECCPFRRIGADDAPARSLIRGQGGLPQAGPRIRYDPSPVNLALSKQTTRLMHSTPEQENAAEAALLRCLFGNPFRPVTISPPS
jgi:hypothetical protein